MSKSKSSQHRQHAQAHAAAALKRMAGKPGMTQAERVKAMQSAANHLATALTQISMALAHAEGTDEPPVDIDTATTDLMAGIEAMLEEGK